MAKKEIIYKEEVWGIGCITNGGETSVTEALRIKCIEVLRDGDFKILLTKYYFTIFPN